MAERESYWEGWQERISALRNVPAVLKIVWDSGPRVVTFGLVSRVFSSLLPVVLLDHEADYRRHRARQIFSRAGQAGLLVAGGGGIFAGCPEQYTHSRNRLFGFVAG